MKKLLLLSCLLGLASLTYAKEVAPVVEEPVVIIEEEPVMPYGHLYFKIGTEIDGEYKTDDVNIFDLDTLSKFDMEDQGVEFAIEGTKYITPNLEMGLGIAFQGHGEGEYETALNVGGPEFVPLGFAVEYESIPLYLVTKYDFPVDWAFTPYIKANLGYSFNTDGELYYPNFVDGRPTNKESFSIDDGMYYGIGLGIEIDHFFAEIMYQVTKGEVDIENFGKIDADVERTTFGIGYKF